MTDPIKPTNRDILKAIREVKDMQIAQGKDIDGLLDWKKGLDIAKSAVEEYKRAEEKTREARQKREIWKQVGIVLGLISAVLYVYLETRGVHP